MGRGESAMKAIIKVCTASKEFTEDQIKIMKRVTMVLMDHDLSADLSVEVNKSIKIKRKEHFKLKAV